MTMMQWDPGLETGIEEIDFQHKQLFSIVNQFLEACEQDKCREEIDGVLKFFEDYSAEHFATEEKLQQQYAYPDYAAHKQAHEEFVKNYTDLKKHYQDEGTSFYVALRTYEIIVDWFIQHIAVVDKKLCDFLKTKK